MDPKNIERAAIYTLIVILSAALIAGAVALIVHFTESETGETEGGGDPPQTTPITDKNTEPAPPESTGSETDADTETDPPETDGEPTPVVTPVIVTKYDEPKIMYALYNVNARESYTTSSVIIGMFYKSEEVTVTGETDSGWYQVKYGTYTAYIRGDLLTDNKAESDITIKVYTASKTMYASSNVNVRESYSTNSSILATIDAGTEVTVIGETDNGWYQVSYNDATAYIKADLLTTSKPASTPDTSDGQDA